MVRLTSRRTPRKPPPELNQTQTKQPCPPKPRLQRPYQHLNLLSAPKPNGPQTSPLSWKNNSADPPQNTPTTQPNVSNTANSAAPSVEAAWPIAPTTLLQAHNHYTTRTPRPKKTHFRNRQKTPRLLLLLLLGRLICPARRLATRLWSLKLRGGRWRSAWGWNTPMRALGRAWLVWAL